MKIEKVLILKIISVVTVSIFLLNSTVYSIGLSNKICLRVPAGLKGIYERMSETMGKDWPAIEQKFRILIDKAESEGELKKLYRTIIMEVHPDRNPAYIVESTEAFKNLSSCFKDRLVKGFNVRPPTNNSDWLADWAAGKSFSAIDRDGIEFGRFVIHIGEPKNGDSQKTTEITSAQIDANANTSDSDFSVGEEERYLRNITVGNLPEAIKGRAYSYPWPVNMADSSVHIIGFYSESDLIKTERSWDRKHFAIDIQTQAGSEVRAVEDGFVVFVQRFDDGMPIDSKAHSFADIWVYSPSSKLLWLYVHLDANSVSLKHRWFDQYEDKEEFRIKAGDIIGKVNKWHTDDALGHINLPHGYSKSYDHLHLEVRYVDKHYDGLGVEHLTPVNPLQLLRPLYSLSQMDFSSRASQTSL